MLQLKVKSMSCNHCISMITKAILQWQTDAKIEADLSTQLIKIESQLSKEKILDALDEAGYPAIVAGSCCSMKMTCDSSQ